MATTKETESLKKFVEEFHTLFPDESTIRQVKHALELYREEFETGQKSDDVPRMLRKALPSIQGDIDVKPYGEPALNRPAPAIAAWETPNGSYSRKKKHTPKAGVPPGQQWRVATTLVKAINKEKLYSTEEGEPQQADDPEEMISETQLAHALQFDEYAIARVLSLCEFHPTAVVAVGHIEDWTWDVTSRFLLSSELIGSCWREHIHRVGSQAQRRAAYGLRRFVKCGSHFGGMLGHVRNIARNPTGDTISYEQSVEDELEINADPHHEAERRLSDFYHTLAVELPFFEQPAAAPGEELTPDTEAGMAALQLQGGRLGRTCRVVQTLLKTSLDSDIVPADVSASVEQQAPCTTAVLATAATAGYTSVGNRFGCGAAAAVGGLRSTAAVPAIPPESDADDDGVLFDATVPRMPQPPALGGAANGWGAGTAVADSKACVRCGVFMCERHRNASDAPTTHNVGAALSTYLLDGPKSAANLREEVRWLKKEWREVCGKDCYKLPASEATGTTKVNNVWTPEEKAKLADWVAVLGRNRCSLADLFHGTHTCREIHAQLAAEPLPADLAVSSDEDGGDVQNIALQGSVRRKKKPKHKMLSTNNQPAAAKRQNRDEQLAWSEYVPCDCDPEKGCGASCACAKEANFCEKHCKCGGNCRNAHPGCKCKTSCTGQTCPCKKQERECDPAKCLGCCATALGTVEAGGVVCQNMNILLGVTRRLAVGLSNVAGWGCFVMEDIKEGEYIGEYTGELLTNEECERRGAVYDRRDSSYLFGLNSKWVIDAQKVGNKLRFANHDRNANARAHVMMLDGDHHVGIYAKTNLAAGTEIFYDYGYAKKGEQYCPDWAEKGENGT